MSTDFLDANYKGGPLTPPTGMEQGLIGRENEVLMDYLTRAQGGKGGSGIFPQESFAKGEGAFNVQTPGKLGSTSGLDLGPSSGGGGYESILAEARNIALGGENLPPGLQGRINDLLTQGENRARAQFGTGFESTTGGQEILKGYRRSADELREGFANTRGTLLTNIASTGQNMQSQSLLDTYRALSASDAFRRTLQTERQTGDATRRQEELQKALIEATNNSGKASLIGSILGGGKGSLGGSILSPIGGAIGAGIVKGGGTLWDWLTGKGGGGGPEGSGNGGYLGELADEFGEAMLPSSGGPEQTSNFGSQGGGGLPVSFGDDGFEAGSDVVFDNPAYGDQVNSGSLLSDSNYFEGLEGLQTDQAGTFQMDTPGEFGFGSALNLAGAAYSLATAENGRDYISAAGGVAPTAASLLGSSIPTAFGGLVSPFSIYAIPGIAQALAPHIKKLMGNDNKRTYEHQEFGTAMIGSAQIAREELGLNVELAQDSRFPLGDPRRYAFTGPDAEIVNKALISVGGDPSQLGPVLQRMMSPERNLLLQGQRDIENNAFGGD